MQSINKVVAIAAIATVGGYGVAIPASEHADSRSESNVEPTRCPEVICGMNSPVIDSFGFHELNLDGAANAQGYRIAIGERGVAQMFLRGTWYDLRVSDNRISGVARGRVLAAADVHGALIPIVRDGARYVLRVSASSELPFYAGARGAVPAYKLEWASGTVGDAAAFSDLCASGGRAADDESRLTEQAVVFEGDRVDARTLTMRAAADDRWFNVGCVGHALSKLLLTRNTVHTQDVALGSDTAWRHRQATLKMLAADYCGTGESFTASHQVLDWQGDAMRYHWPKPREIEARWDETGAICLGTPRRQRAGVEGPAIARACVSASRTAPPPCRDVDPDAFDGALRVSANP